MTNLLLLGFLPSGSEWIRLRKIWINRLKRNKRNKGIYYLTIYYLLFDTLRSSGVWVGLLPFPQRSPNSK